MIREMYVSSDEEDIESQCDVDPERAGLTRPNRDMHNRCCGGKAWCIKDICGIICAVLTWMLIVYAEFVVMMVMLLPGLSMYPLYSYVNIFLFQSLAFLAFASHLRTMFTDSSKKQIWIPDKKLVWKDELKQIWRTEKKQIWIDDKKLVWKEAWQQIWKPSKKLIWVPDKKLEWKEAWKQIWIPDWKQIWVPGVKKIWRPVWISEWFPSPDHHEHHHESHGWDRSDNGAAASQKSVAVQAAPQQPAPKPPQQSTWQFAK